MEAKREHVGEAGPKWRSEAPPHCLSRSNALKTSYQQSPKTRLAQSLGLSWEELTLQWVGEEQHFRDPYIRANSESLRYPESHEEVLPCSLKLVFGDDSTATTEEQGSSVVGAMSASTSQYYRHCHMR